MFREFRRERQTRGLDDNIKMDIRKVGFARMYSYQ